MHSPLPAELRERIAQRILALAVPGVLAGAAALATALPFIAPHELTRLVPLAAVAASALLARWQARRGQGCRGASVLVAGVLLATALAMALHGGMHAPGAVLPIGVMVLIAALHGPRATALALVGVAAVGACFVFAEGLGWVVPPPASPAFLLWLIYTVMMVVSTLFALVPVALMVQALRDREIQAIELERARLAERTRALEFQAVFDQSFQMMGLLDPAGVMLQTNATSLGFIGATAAAVIGRPFPDTPWWSAEQRPQVAAAIRRAAAGERVAFTAVIRDRQGAQRTIDFSLTPFRDPAGTVIYLIPEGRDITALAEAEARLQQALKMDSLGQLAGGVAHDFNNMLTGIGMATDLLERGLARGDGPEAQRAHLLVVRKAAERAAELTRHLLLFARKTPPEHAAVDLHATVRAAIALLERSVDKRIRIAFAPAAGTPLVLGNAGQLEHALINLGLNARDAMPGQGLLSFTVGVLDIGPAGERLGELHLAPGRHATVAVRDTGEGMDEATRRHLFEPFFTTKGSAGTGLGLASVYGTVGDHGGIIHVDTAPGTGSCFTLYLPLHQGPPVVAAEPTPAGIPATAAGTGGCILLVDDEPSLRQMAAEVLEVLGYAVVTAASGRDALERFTAHPDLFDLLVVDMSMPGMSGGELCHAIRAAGSRVPIIIASGYASQDSFDQLRGLGNLRMMQKPYRIHALGLMVAEALAGTAESPSRP